jgi:outer membrane protein
MKHFQTILTVLLLAAVSVLYYFHFSGGEVKKNKAASANTGKEKKATAEMPVRIAYIDLDTIKEYYEYFRLKNDEIEREKQRIENEIQASVNKLEKDRVDFLKRGESITQIEAENFQRDYQNRYQQLGVRRETLLNQHLSNQAKAFDEIQKKINEFLEEYNKTAGYQFIFSVGEGNLSLYYKDSTFDITREVVKGLNESYKKTRSK